MMPHRLLATLATIAVLAGPAHAQQADDPRQAPTVASGILSLLPADSATTHVLKTGKRDVPYTATAGTLDLRGQDGAVSARVFYTAYVAKDGGPGRPLAFVFNGGPGAASAYLHLGLVGPKILDFGPAGGEATTPALRDNPESWLEFTDLVFIDPVGTGWSRAASDDKARNFYGVKQDAESLAKVISLYVQRNQRLAQPKYLVGESYGGFRAAKVAMALKDSQGILVSGVIMLSPLIEAKLIFGATDYPLGAALQFPSLAAAELERRHAFTEEKLADAERFAMSGYMTALAGPEPMGDEADKFYAKVAEITGIPRDAVVQARGFVGDIYAKGVLGTSGKIVSPYDASYAAPDPYPEATFDRGEDPILDGFTRAYGAAFTSYVRNDLGFPCEMTYSLLNTEVNRQWEWGDGTRGSRSDASVTDDIRVLLSTIPSFRLMIAHGYSDALTPYGASRYVLDHLPSSLAGDRTSLKLYRGGHMFYTSDGSRKAATEDARAFFTHAPKVD
jgi:carboxypeptidase C (cathepsin A)